MEIVLKYIQSILLILLILVQLALLIYLFFVNHKRFEEDKKFWKRLEEDMNTTREKFECLDVSTEEAEDGEKTNDQT